MTTGKEAWTNFMKSRKHRRGLVVVVALVILFGIFMSL